MLLRHKAILDHLRTNNLVTVEELADLTKASASTIRRDLIKLDQDGMVYRVHGGVTLNRFVKDQPTTQEKLAQHHQEKERIGKRAAEFIADGDAVVLDAGTTTMEIAKQIYNLQLKIITSDLHIGIFLAEHNQLSVTLTGGIVDWSSQSCIGTHALDIMRKLHPTYTFVSCNAFNLNSGITAPTQDKADFKAGLLNQDSKRFLITDSSKYGKVQLFEVTPLEKEFVDVIITDKGLPSKTVEQIRARGIEVITT